jgi:hypothetical protein
MTPSADDLTRAATSDTGDAASSLDGFDAGGVSERCVVMGFLSWRSGDDVENQEDDCDHSDDVKNAVHGSALSGAEVSFG